MALTEVNSLGIKDLEVKTGDIAADAITGAKIADDAIDSEHYVDGSIDNAHLADDAVGTAEIADDAITNALMADDAVGVAQLSATGTASSSTFLRGDNAWAAPGGGKVVQYVWATDSTNITATSSLVEVMDATITPTSSSNKILVQCLTRVYSDASSYAFYGGYIKRGDASGTTIATYSGGLVTSQDIETMCPIWWLDEPNTTSATEYTLTLSRWSSGTTSVTTNSYANSMLLLELEG
jgi:hypothetical protein